MDRVVKSQNPKSQLSWDISNLNLWWAVCGTFLGIRHFPGEWKKGHQANVSPSQCITKPMYHQANASPSQCVTKPMYHQANVSPSQCVTKPPCHQANVSPSHHVTKPMRHQATVSPSQHVTQLMHHPANASPSQCDSEGSNWHSFILYEISLGQLVVSKLYHL